MLATLEEDDRETLDFQAENDAALHRARQLVQWMHVVCAQEAQILNQRCQKSTYKILSSPPGTR